MAKLTKEVQEAEVPQFTRMVRKQELQTREDFYEGENEVLVRNDHVEAWVNSGWGWEVA